MTSFETQTCTRCFGSGHYSYNQMTGTRCFGCEGTGKQLTRRGSIARQWFIEKLERPIEDIKIGERVNVPGLGKFRVVEIETKDYGDKSLRDGVMVPVGPRCEIRSAPLPNNQGCLALSGYPGQTKVRLILPAAENNKLLEDALAYQATLSNAKPQRKRSK